MFIECHLMFRLHPDTELMTMCTAVEHGGEDEWDFLSVFVGGGQDRVRALGALSCTTNVTLMQRLNTSISF